MSDSGRKPRDRKASKLDKPVFSLSYRPTFVSMIQFHRLSYHPGETVRSIAEQAGSDVQSTESSELRTTFAGIALGAITFPDGINLLTIRGNPGSDIELPFAAPSEPWLRFIFCQAGSMTYQVEAEIIGHSLAQLQSITTAPGRASSPCLRLPAQPKIRAVILDIEREPFLDHYAAEAMVDDRARQELFSEEPEETFFRISHYNLAQAECIDSLLENEYEGLVRRVFLHAKASELLVLKSYQHQQEHARDEQQVLLSDKEVEMIVRAKNIQALDLKNAPTISELARQVGTNESKLKQNFKKVYGKTINESLTDERFNYARMLLAANELNVKRVSLEVGYKNPSHFSRLFKEKFGMLPKDFLKAINNSAKESVG